MIYKMTSKGQMQNLTSVEGHDLTQIGHAAYQLISLDEINTMNLSWSLYLASIPYLGGGPGSGCALEFFASATRNSATFLGSVADP